MTGPPDPAQAAHTPSGAADAQRQLVQDLQQRIADLNDTEDAAFGGFTTLDWCLCVAGAVVLPYAAVCWFWP